MKKLMIIAVAVMFTVFTYAQDKKKTEIKVSDLPKGVAEYVSKNIPGGKITRAAKVEENGVVTYVSMVNANGTDHPYKFDKDGKFLGKPERPKGAPATQPPAKTTEAKSATKPAATEEAPKK